MGANGSASDTSGASPLDTRLTESVTMSSATALGKRWPSIDYVYLMPVSHALLPRGGALVCTRDLSGAT